MRKLLIEKRGQITSIKEDVSADQSRVWTFSSDAHATKQAADFDIPAESLFTDKTSSERIATTRNFLSRALDYIA